MRLYTETGSTIGGVEITLGLGDLTAAGAEAYIVPQFEDCASEGGVGGAIARSGASRGVIREYEALLAKANGSLPFGFASVTPSHGGNAQRLIHVVSVGSGDKREFNTVATAIFNALVAAYGAGIKSIAAPMLGTGIIGSLTDEQSARAMMSAVARFDREYPNADMRLTFVAYGNPADTGHPAFRALKSVLENAEYEGVSPVVGQREFDPVRFQSELQRDVDLNAVVASGSAHVGDESVALERIELEHAIYGQKRATKADLWRPTVDETIKAALELSTRVNDVVLVQINGVTVPVYCRSDIGGAYIPAEEAVARADAYYNAESSRQAEAYRNSPEGKAAAAAFEKQKLDEQAEVDRLIADLPNVVGQGQDAVVAWVGKFGVLNDANYIRFDAEAIATQLEATGLGSLDFDSIPEEERGPLAQCKNRNVMAQILITNAVIGLRGEMGAIHPVSGAFADIYAKLPAVQPSQAPRARGAVRRPMRGGPDHP